jgi:hypothetical protein
VRSLRSSVRRLRPGRLPWRLVPRPTLLRPGRLPRAGSRGTVGA